VHLSFLELDWSHNHLMECTDVFQFLLYMLSSTMFGIEPKKKSVIGLAGGGGE